MLAPVKLPSFTSYGARSTCTVSIASSEIGLVRVLLPGWPEVPVCPPSDGEKPIASLLMAPSIVTLLYRKLVPRKELSFDPCGVRRVKSCRLLEVDGRLFRLSLLMFSPAPNRPDRRRRFAVTTATDSCWACGTRMNEKVCGSPRVTITDSRCWVTSPV